MMLNLKEFVEKNYSYQAEIAESTDDHNVRRAINNLFDDLYEHYFEKVLGNDSEWTKIDFEDESTFPNSGQPVTYFLKVFGNTFEGYYDEGTFFSNAGFCDYYDAPYWKPRKERDTILISGFPGVGKTEYTKQFKIKYRILDSDSSRYSWTIDENGEKIRNPEFPENYINHINLMFGLVDVIFVSSHKDVRNYLADNNIPFTLVYPDVKLKDEYIERYKQRGSSEEFVDMMNEKWDEFISECESQVNCTYWKLKSGEFMSSVLKILEI